MSGVFKKMRRQRPVDIRLTHTSLVNRLLSIARPAPDAQSLPSSAITVGWWLRDDDDDVVSTLVEWRDNYKRLVSFLPDDCRSFVAAICQNTKCHVHCLRRFRISGGFTRLHRGECVLPEPSIFGCCFLYALFFTRSFAPRPKAFSSLRKCELVWFGCEKSAMRKWIIEETNF